MVSDEDRDQLVRWARRRSSAQGLALRSRIVLACAAGLDNTAVAEREQISPATVGKWRRRFVEFGLDGLSDDPRPGRPPSVTADQVEDCDRAVQEPAPAHRGLTFLKYVARAYPDVQFGVAHHRERTGSPNPRHLAQPGQEQWLNSGRVSSKDADSVGMAASTLSGAAVDVAAHGSAARLALAKSITAALSFLMQDHRKTV